jgi:hypothetical protein
VSTGAPVRAGGTFFRFKAGTVGASGAHARYITRERAVLDREQGMLSHNLPDNVHEAHGYEGMRDNLGAYAEEREAREIELHRGSRQPRTHYRALMSFERDVSTDKALGMAREWLDRELPEARAFAVVHRDTEHTHVHVWIDARQEDGRKIHLSRDRHRALDQSWNRIYARELGRDPLEHERKKDLTREAKREGWARGTRPDYPPRVRATADDLAPRWERRELGVQAARAGRERPDGSFLEKVRTVAGEDFKQAESWGELDRRLERHGLRVEPRGAGMVVTDGREAVKASSVDRAASRGALERRFGQTLSEHRRSAPDLERNLPGPPGLVQDLSEMERRSWTRDDHTRATNHTAAARARADSMRWAVERATAAGSRFDAALETCYEDARRARAGFDRMAREHGVEKAVRTLRERPEHFGYLNTQEQRRMMGLLITRNDSFARMRATNAAELGREAVEARAKAPTAWEAGRAAAVLRAAEARERALGLAIRGDGHRLVRERAGHALRAFQKPQDMQKLARVVALPQIAAAVQHAGLQAAKEALLTIARQMELEKAARLGVSLAELAAQKNPALAIGKHVAKDVAKRVMDLLNDRDRERGRGPFRE